MEVDRHRQVFGSFPRFPNAWVELPILRWVLPGELLGSRGPLQLLITLGPIFFLGDLLGRF